MRNISTLFVLVVAATGFFIGCGYDSGTGNDDMASKGTAVMALTKNVPATDPSTGVANPYPGDFCLDADITVTQGTGGSATVVTNPPVHTDCDDSVLPIMLDVGVNYSSSVDNATCYYTPSAVLGTADGFTTGVQAEIACDVTVKPAGFGIAENEQTQLYVNITYYIPNQMPFQLVYTTIGEADFNLVPIPVLTNYCGLSVGETMVQPGDLCPENAGVCLQLGTISGCYKMCGSVNTDGDGDVDLQNVACDGNDVCKPIGEDDTTAGTADAGNDNDDDGILTIGREGTLAATMHVCVPPQ